MDLDSALYMAMVDDDITKHCHVNSNEDGDRFVGIKADSDNAGIPDYSYKEGESL